MLAMKMAMAMKCSPPEDTPAFTSSGTAANTASIMPMKWVIALPGSLIVICIWIPPDFVFTDINIICHRCKNYDKIIGNL